MACSSLKSMYQNVSRYIKVMPLIVMMMSKATVLKTEEAVQISEED